MKDLELSNLGSEVAGTVPADQTAYFQKKIFVYDTALSDHADETVSGTIAKALLDAKNAGGGIVETAPDIFDLVSGELTVGEKVSLRCHGFGATVINQTHVTANAINIASGVDFTAWRGVLSDLQINMPTAGTPGTGINLTDVQASAGEVNNVFVNGGNASSWGITPKQNNTTNFSHIEVSGGMNGIDYNIAGAAFNFGDCQFNNIDIILSLANTTGIKLEGTGTKSVNNILMNRVEIRTNGLANQLGLVLELSATRNTFNHFDFENLAEDIQINNSNCQDNTFIHMSRPTGLGVISNDFSNFRRNTFVGGNGDYKPLASYKDKVSPNTAITVNTTIDKFLHGGQTITNAGATGLVTHTLPDAGSNDQGNADIEFFLATAQPIAFALADAGDRIIDQTGALKTTWTSTGVIGTYIKLKSMSFNRWVVVSQIGSWS